MNLSFDSVEKYGKTFLDFWRLGPKALHELSAPEKEMYFRPFEFLAISMALTLSMLLIEYKLLNQIPAIALNNTTLKLEVDYTPLAGLVIILIIVLIFTNAAFNSLISRLWPIRAHFSFQTVLSYECYIAAALSVSYAAINACVIPFIVALSLYTFFAKIVLIGYALITVIVSTIVYLKYSVPSLSLHANISQNRVFWGVTLWGTVVYTILGILIGLIFIND